MFIGKTLAALGLAAASAIAPAHAISIQFEVDTGTVMTSGIVEGADEVYVTDYRTGGLNYTTAAGTSFEAFCVELAQGHAEHSEGFLNYSEQSFLGTQAVLLQGLFSSTYGGVDSDWKRGAFQLAVWEITHETHSGALDVSTGAFQFLEISSTSTATENQAMIDLANSYLTAASSYGGPALYTLSRLVHPSAQDLVFASPVPEPSTYALMMGGLIVLGLRKRRRDD